MFGKKFLGLKGKQLNWAISIIAGLDFLLFGYDQGVMGGLLTLPSFNRTFPEIDIERAAPADRKHVTNIHGIAVASYNVGKWGFSQVFDMWANFLPDAKWCADAVAKAVSLALSSASGSATGSAAKRPSSSVLSS
jgi:hypothetical protein